MTLRLFIAVACPETPGIRHILRVLRDLQPAVKPVDIDQLHFTLRFLGDMNDAHVPALREGIDRAVRAYGKSIPISFTRLGRFPVDPRKAIRVVYADPAEPMGLMELAEQLDVSLEQTMGEALPARDRDFRAHLTLARVKAVRLVKRSRVPTRPRVEPYVKLRELVETHQRAKLGSALMNTVHLYASTLTQAGPRYESLHCAHMAASVAR